MTPHTTDSDEKKVDFHSGNPPFNIEYKLIVCGLQKELPAFLVAALAAVTATVASAATTVSASLTGLVLRL